MNGLWLHGPRLGGGRRGGRGYDGSVSASRHSCRMVPGSRGRRRVLLAGVLAFTGPGTSHAQLSSSLPNPATTSRRAESWAVIESRRRVSRFDLGLERLELALGVGVTAVAQRLGLLLGGADDLLGLAARTADQLLGLLGGLLAVGAGGLGGLAGPQLGGVGALLGLVDESLGLRHGGSRGSRRPHG